MISVRLFVTTDVFGNGVRAMSFMLIPPTWRSNQPMWQANYKADTVVVTTQQDAGLARTSGCMVVATSSQGGSIAYDFTWPQVLINVNSHSIGAQGPPYQGTGIFQPGVLTFSTWVRARPGQTYSGQLALWDLSQQKNDTVPFEAGDSWQWLTLSAEHLGAGDEYRIEIYLTAPNVDLLLDRMSVI